MQKINNTKDLRTALYLLQAKKLEKEERIMRQAAVLKESLRPVNLAKNALAQSAVLQGIFRKKSLPARMAQIGIGLVLKRIFAKPAQKALL